MGIDEIKKMIDAWLESEGGMKSLDRAINKAYKISRELRKASQINPCDLNRPMTI